MWGCFAAVFLFQFADLTEHLLSSFLCTLPMAAICKTRTTQNTCAPNKKARTSHQALPWWGACCHSATTLDFLTTIRCDGVFTEASTQTTTSVLTHLRNQITYWQWRNRRRKKHTLKREKLKPTSHFLVPFTRTIKTFQAALSLGVGCCIYTWPSRGGCKHTARLRSRVELIVAPILLCVTQHHSKSLKTPEAWDLHKSWQTDEVWSDLWFKCGWEPRYKCSSMGPAWAKPVAGPVIGPSIKRLQPQALGSSRFHSPAGHQESTWSAAHKQIHCHYNVSILCLHPTFNFLVHHKRKRD